MLMDWKKVSWSHDSNCRNRQAEMFHKAPVRKTPFTYDTLKSMGYIKIKSCS